MIAPRSQRIDATLYHLKGILGDYLRGVSEQWLKIAPSANPGMLEIFRDRDRLPYRDMVPWAGEFAGKYLTGAVQVLRLTGDAQLKSYLARFVAELISLQAEDGYLGPWPGEFRMMNRVEYSDPEKESHGTWDTWGHYHVMMGLMLWHERTEDDSVLTCVRQIADLICEKYLGNKSPRLVQTGDTDKNFAPAHALCLLYRKTGTQRYLDMALQIVDEFSAKDLDSKGKHIAGDYLNTALAGTEFFETPKPRWESLHPIMALAELYYLTSDESYRRAFEHIWWSIVKLDRHNNGGFSSGERAQGNPYHQGAIETCCTIAWIAMSVEMLRLTRNSVVADELELSTLNSVVGMHSHTGRWATYNTPMDGVRRASAHDIVFQAREGTPELNCCSVNSARGFGMVSDWALMRDDEGLILNWYGPGSMTAEFSPEVTVTLTQETDYPRGSDICLTVSPSAAASFALKLRIPYWSAKTTVAVNGREIEQVRPSTYLCLNQTWQPGDTVNISLDMSLHYWVGEHECAGRVSIFRGPLLLTYDRRFNQMDPDDIPVLDAQGLVADIVVPDAWIPPLLLMEFAAADGRKVRLCDFGSAGEGGSPYKSWLTVHNVEKTEFSESNPLRSAPIRA